MAVHAGGLIYQKEAALMTAFAKKVRNDSDRNEMFEQLLPQSRRQARIAFHGESPSRQEELARSLMS